MHLPKRVLTVATAAVLALNGMLVGAALTSDAVDGTVRYELEDGTYTGTLKEDAAASGGAYVFFDNANQTATASVPVDADGMYDIYIGYNAQYGDKIEYLLVDGVNQGQVSMEATAKDEIAEVKGGTVLLTAGTHEIGVQCSWSWVNVDYVRIEAAVLPEVTASDKSCSDPNATEEAQKLMEFLSSVYGEYVISGQQEFYGESRSDEFDYIQNTTGQLPVIRGFDFGETCPLYAWDAKTTERIIDWVNVTGGIATASWHVNVPVTMADYTPGNKMAFESTTYSNKTDFVVENCMIEGTKEYQFFEEAVDNLATELLEIQDAGVPLLFRPFHEAEGNGGADGAGAWFWWSKDGAEIYVELYRYLFNKLTQEYGLHNLIWEFNSYTYSESEAFYPGRDYVDIIGFDKYNANGGVPNESAISSTFYSLIEMYDNTKMIALMENDTIPSVENMTAEGATWLYFMPWYGDHLMSTAYNDPTTLSEIYNSDLVITLDEFKEMYADFTPSGTTSSRPTTTPGPTTTRVTTTTVTTTAPTITDGITAEISKSGQDYIITFDQAMGDTVVLVVDTVTGLSFANGCIGVSANVDGTDYWVNYQWVYEGKDEITVDLNTPYNVTYNAGSDEVTDEDMIARISAAAQQQKSGQVQVWWANDGNGDALPPTTSVTLLAAYIPGGGGDTTTGEPDDTTQAPTTTTTTAPVDDNKVSAEIKPSGENYKITFDQAMGDTVILELEAGDDVSYANGCVGVSANVGGTDYWISYQWEYTGNSTVTVDLNTPFEVSYDNGTAKVEDEALIAEVVAAAQAQTSAEVQTWWANDGADDALPPAASITLIDAYLPAGAEDDTTSTPDATTTTEPATTTTEADTTESTEDTTTTTEAPSTTTAETTTTAVSTSETDAESEPPTTTTTADSDEPVEPGVCGDVNADGDVTLADVILLNKASMNVVDLSALGRVNGDVNADGETDGNDATILLQFIVQIVSKLPYIQE